MTKFEDNQSPYLTLDEQASAPATPASGLALLYRKTDNKLYMKDDAGTETEVVQAGGAPTAHASSHADGGSDEVNVEELAATSTTTTQVLMPDGLGGVEFAALVTGDLPAFTIDQASDVDTDKSKTPADGDVLTFDGTHWNAEAGGGGASSLSDLSDVNLISPSPDEILVYGGYASYASGASYGTTPKPTITGSGISFGVVTNAWGDSTAFVGVDEGGYIQWEFATAQSFAAFDIQWHDGASPDHCRMWCSDDGVSWTQVWEATGLDAAVGTGYPTIKYDFDDMSRTAKFWKLENVDSIGSRMEVNFRFFYLSVGSGAAFVNSLLALGDLSDVTVSGSETDGQVLTSDGLGGFAFEDAAAGGASVTVQASEPATPSSGDLWFDTDEPTADSIATGTAFPASPSLGQRFRRSDLDYAIYFYDGTRWLTEQVFTLNMVRGNAPDNDYVSDTANLERSVLHATQDIYVLSLEGAVYQGPPADGSNYWTISLNKVDSADALTVVGSFTTAAVTASSWNSLNATVNDTIDVSAFPLVRLRAVKTGSAGWLFPKVNVRYRLIAS